MIIKIAWLYYDLLELYGDQGNIKVLEDILQDNGLEYKIDKITIHDPRDISTHDIVFLGGGSDRAQKLIAKDLEKRKTELQNIMLNKGFIFTVCGGYQMFGKYYLDITGKKIPGLGLFKYYTVAGKNRSVGNIKIEVFKDINNSYEVVGFENHSGETYNVGDKYFGRVVKGNGNKYKGGYEGYKDDHFLGTYIHGPLLPKNPMIGKEILEQVLKEKYNVEINLKLKYLDTIEKAKEAIQY